jgi:hypothetical protein
VARGNRRRIPGQSLVGKQRWCVRPAMAGAVDGGCASPEECVRVCVVGEGNEGRVRDREGAV